MVRSESPHSAAAGDGVAEALLLFAADVVVKAARAAWMLMCWAVAFPMFSVPVLICLSLDGRYGWPAAVTAGVGFGLLLAGWRLTDPASFRRWVTGRIRARWRRWRVYRAPWRTICALHGLTATLDDQVLVPRLRKVTIGAVSDLLTVRMLTGQTVPDWQTQAEALAHAFGALAVRIRPAKPGWVWLEVQHTDPLAAPVPLRVPVEPVDLDHVTVGVSEAGDSWSLRALGRHVLVAGATGAGKGSVVWSLLAGLAPGIRDGLVQVWVVDPKGGMEFGPGAGLFHRFAYDRGQETLQLLRDAASVMTSRALALRGHTRQHAPSSAEPLIVVVIDEIATLTAYLTDRKVRAEVEQLLGLLLSQGRAVGVSVIACVQDPAKDVLPLRQLFPTRIGLRMTEATHVAMVLGQAARDRGAACEQIPDSLPGVGYLMEDGASEPVRVRAFHATDADIARLVDTYHPRSTDGVAGDGMSWPEAA